MQPSQDDHSQTLSHLAQPAVAFGAGRKLVWRAVGAVGQCIRQLDCQQPRLRHFLLGE